MIEVVKNFETLIDLNAGTQISSEALARAINEFYLFQNSPSGSFNHLLFALIQKADSSNLLRLAVVYPSEVAVFKAWWAWNMKDDFFSVASRWLSYYHLKNKIGIVAPQSAMI